MQHMSGRCVLNHFQDERSKIKVTLLFQILVLSAPGLRPNLTESLHMWHTYNTWGGNVSRTIFRSKSQYHFNYWKFFCVHPVASPLFDRITIYMTYIQCIRGWCAARPFQDERSKVKVTLFVLSFVDIQHMSGDVSCTIFWMKGRRSKSHGLKFWPCPLRGFVPILFDGITSCMACIQHTCIQHMGVGGGAYAIFRSICRRSRSHRSFHVFPLSAPWLRPYLANNFI